MDQDARRRYNALTARDPRFDGVFFVGVTSTDVYCRPICPAKTPRQANCRFFDTPQEAEQAGFRPCLRCRPELAPGSAPVDDAQRIARLIVQRLEEGTLDERAGLEEISDQFELSSRQIRRIVQKELGVPPIQLLLTRRLLLAKQLLTETALPITEVAFASGFSSLRRFNDAFNRRYGMPPTRLRKRATEGTAANVERHTSTLRLSYRPPYDWTGILAFLAARALKGVEHLTDSSYARTVQLGEASGWIRVTQSPKTHALMVEFTHSLTPVLPALLSRVRALFDLDARPDVIAKHLRKDARLAASVKANPGMRVPGAFNGFEMGLRAILGQQVTVKAATTIAGRFVEAFGSPIATPFAELNRLTPAPTRIAAARADDIARHGIISARCRSIIALADAQTSDDLCLDGGGHHNPDDTISRLADLPGIGSWTAQYIAMRALRWPDAFPKEDIAVRHNLGGVTAKEADVMSQRWRPWRSYAVMHVWGMSKRLVPARPRLACVMAIVGLLSASHIARAQSTPPDTVARAEALPQVIPIFPLEVPMLFPGVSRPLHIFEPRYRAMVADALKGDRIIGMTTLKPGYESDYQGRPPVYDIGCAGLITDVEELPGGRFNIELRCVVKFRVTSEDESRAYRLARVEAVPEVADAEEKATLGKLRQRLEELITKGSDSKVSPDTPDEELVNTVAQYIPLGNAERQALLELKSALLRVRALIELIASKTARPRLSV